MTNPYSQEQNQPVREKRKQDYLAYDVSFSVAHTIGAEPNTCFDNILDLFQFFPDVFASHTFVEGWYVVDLEDEVVINEHGWVEMPDGKILDPTVVILLPPERPVYYFPGIERSCQEVKEITLQKDFYFPYVRYVGTYGEDGLGHPTYKAAYEAATRKVFDLAAATQPPKKMTFLAAQDPDAQQDMGISIHLFFPSSEQDEEGQRGE
ncbi:hypothetical protein ccbrp13_20200 [Ktedonobacteria bacterium brp13]|nr:hypothetical protein ccbrp13_20200 [Ktedonobacteria bacterium brp13]